MSAEIAAGQGKRPGLFACSLGLGALAVAVVVVWQSATLFRLDLAFTAIETELSFWGRGDYQATEATRRRIAAELDELLARAPTRPDYLALAGYHLAWLAYREDDPSVARRYALQAAEAQFLAQQSRPAYRQGWAKMVGYARRAGDADGAVALGRLAQQRRDALVPGSHLVPPT